MSSRTPLQFIDGAEIARRLTFEVLIDARDGAAIADVPVLTVKALDDAEIVLVDAA